MADETNATTRTDTAPIVVDADETRIVPAKDADTSVDHEALNAAADTTNDDVSSVHVVSRTEHAMGSRQPDDGTYDDLRKQPPLEGRDIPQVIVRADNDTPTPGEKVG